MGNAIASGVVAGERRSIARAISLVESGTQEGHALAEQIHSHTGRAIVVGVTGPPGVGKSTLVDQLVARLRERRATAAIVAVDPSSGGGGALLGDRVRMRSHSTDPGVFVRSIATRGSLGGIATACGPAVRILDAAGYDVVLIETVGVGQAEIDVAALADCVLFVLAPGIGDEIQAAKSGVLEVADLFVVNRADEPAAVRTAQELDFVITLRRGLDAPATLLTEARTGRGSAELLDALDSWIRARLDDGEITRRREEAVVKAARSAFITEVGRRASQCFDRGFGSAMRNDLVSRRRTPASVAGQILTRSQAAMEDQ